MNRKIYLLLLSLFLPINGMTDGTISPSGFIADSHLSVLARNFFWDHRDRTFGNSKREWGQGLQAQFISGYTRGVVGVGVDAQAYAALKLDSTRSRMGTQLLPEKTNGRSRSESTSIGGAVKVRVSHSELKYGEVRPYNPVFAIADARLMPATVTGFWFTSEDVERLFVEAGHFTRAKDYNQTGSHEAFYAGYASHMGPADEVNFLGGTYGLGSNASVTLYGAQFKELWQQYYVNVHTGMPLTPNTGFDAGLTAYHNTDEGKAKLGDVEVTAWSLALDYRWHMHIFSAGYQKVHGDQPLDYLMLGGYGFQDSLFLGNASQYADFNGPNEQSWRVGYTLDLTTFGLPGGTVSLAHIRGSDIDGTNAKPTSAYHGMYGKNEKHHSTDFDARYTLQNGPAKGLNIVLRHAHHRMTQGESDGHADRFRLYVEYPYDIF